MRPVPRILLAFMVGRAVFGVLFLLSVIGHWRLPWYLPIEHRWVIATSVQGVGMDWYGRSALAILGGGATGLASYALGGSPRAARWFGRPTVIVGVARLGGTMLLFDVVFYAAILLTRVLHPIPLPAWYCPR